MDVHRAALHLHAFRFATISTALTVSRAFLAHEFPMKGFVRWEE
jgi:hypothetical protein